MTIITFQNQDCKGYEPIILNKDMVADNLFNELSSTTLRSKCYQDLLKELQKNLFYRSSKTKYAQAKVLINNIGGSNNSRYKQAMSHLKKLGLILEHEGYLYLNPLVRTKYKPKYELVLEYYNLLWSEAFKASVYIKYKDFRFTLGSSESIKTLIAEDYKELLQRDENVNHLTTQQLYDVAFTYKKSELDDEQFLENIGVNQAHYLTTLKSKMSKIYTNLGNNCMREIAPTHYDLLHQQLPIQRLENNLVSFGKLPLKWKCIHFSDTPLYQEAISLYNLQDNISTSATTTSMNNKTYVNIPSHTTKEGLLRYQKLLSYLYDPKHDDSKFRPPTKILCELTCPINRKQQPQQYPNYFTQDELFTVVQPTITKVETNNSTPSNSMYHKKYNKFSLYLTEEFNKEVEYHKLNNTLSSFPYVEKREQLDKEIEACENWLGNPQSLPFKCRHLVES